MPNPPLTYDARNMMAKAVGRAGTTPAELRSLARRMEQAKRDVKELSMTGAQGWLSLPDDTGMVRRVMSLAREKRDFSTCLVIGIGGSDLGARCLDMALNGAGMELAFAGANTDPDELHAILKGLDLKRTFINVISKSGDTIEPMATFFIVRDALIRAVGSKRHAEHIVATTDAESGSLRDLATREGYDTLPVPGNVGGRFSVLSDVGLFPLACAGVDIRRLLQGARQERDRFVREATLSNGPSLFAALNYLAVEKRGQHIHVLMPYAESLRGFGFWFRQLWAESLGKRVVRGKKTLNVGPTPVAALGATDQHSQIQLYNEGPNDKTITFIRVESFRHNVRIPAAIKDIPSLAPLAGMPLERILHAEEQGTAAALTAAKRPNGVISIPAVTPEAMGSLIMFFELATAVSGQLYGLDAFDQPGVEAGKRATRAILTA
ncbi:glucose-6-phosphate isomerase [Patescibacteria group bacterium]|nr:glucose-6-phosphate isomerase [Patescibacteria group bacterium]MBU2613064.1 glucose-6-phosphate isomerase [Patescibacteria group bacterium]